MTRRHGSEIHGREMPNDEPALLKRREYLRRDAAEQRWKELLRLGLVNH